MFTSIHTVSPPGSGQCLGGLGSGGLELWPDGVFRNPGFLNTRPWASNNRDKHIPETPPFGVEDLFFLLRLRRAGDAEPTVRFLFTGQGNAFRSWGHMSRTYKYARIPSVPAVDYRCEGALVRLDYRDADLPVEVALEAWSPLVPHDHEACLLPGIAMDVLVRNRGPEAVEVSLILCAANLAGEPGPGVRQSHALFRDGASLTVQMRGSTESGLQQRDGTQAIAADGRGGWDLSAVAANPWMENLLHPILCGGDLTGPMEPARLQKEELLEAPQTGASRNRAWLCGRRSLGPGEQAMLRFAYGWHFPNHIDHFGERPGKAYVQRFADARAAVSALLLGAEDWKEGVRRLPRLLRDSDIPPALARAMLDQLGTLSRCTWVTGDGTLFLWEGYGEACLNTVDVDHYSAAALSLLWPGLRRSALESIRRGQREDGGVPHGYTAHTDPARIQPVEYTRWDCHCHYILATYREWRSGAYAESRELAARFLSVEKALQRLESLIPSGADLPRIAGGITYDHWHMEGLVTYMASLYLTTLSAAVRLAEAAGAPDAAALWSARRVRGIAEAERLLWNGESYRTLHPEAQGGARVESDAFYEGYGVGGGVNKTLLEGLHTDGLNGEATALLLGLPSNLDPLRVRRTLEQVLERNVHADTGFLANGSSPDGSYPDLFPYSQWQNPWTGTEYYFAAHLYALGMGEEATARIGAVERRLAREGMRFNHIECGDHYSRALSIYAAYQAWSGVLVDIPEGRLDCGRVPCPAVVPLLTPTGLGFLRLAETHATLEWVSGTFTLSHLHLPKPLAERRLEPPVVLTAGDRLAFAAEPGTFCPPPTQPPARSQLCAV